MNPVLRWQTPLPELVGVFIANDRHQLKIAKCTVDKLNAIDTSKYTTTPTHTHTHVHAHTHHLMDLCLGLPRWTGTRKVKPIWILLKQQKMSGSDISWAMCKSVPCFRQINMPAHHNWSFFTGRMPFLPPNQQHQSTTNSIKIHFTGWMFPNLSSSNCAWLCINICTA